MLVLQRIHTWTNQIIPFIKKFIEDAGEYERTEEQIIDQIKVALVNGRAGLWLLKKDGIVHGYLFVEVVPTEYKTQCILVHQISFDPKVGFKSWKETAKILLRFGEQWNAEEIFFLTRRDPTAFIRLFKDGWEIESFILRRRKSVVPRGANGVAHA